MILGFVSDAHGNPVGLARCLETLERRAAAERIYFLGDAVGYLPEENAVLDLLRQHDVKCVRGNHEAMLLGDLPIPEDRGPMYRLQEANARVSEENLAWMREWPSRLELELGGRRLLLVHGSLADPLQGYVYPDTDLAPLAALPFDVVAMGHTHRPFVAAAGQLTVMNVGSCGMPRDVGNLASCACYDTATGMADVLRVPFDAGGLAAGWNGRIHPAAAECLRREAAAPVFGEIVSNA